VIMGCYGIGVSRTMAASVEQNRDENGIIWPLPIAPYHVVITMMKPTDAAHADVAAKLAKDLSEQGVDVLIDDRDERPGVKFKDADLIGIPLRITIGDKALAEGAVEFKDRKATDKGQNVKIDEIVGHCVAAVAAAHTS
jgi:prolyl-tRNA synthetase